MAEFPKYDIRHTAFFRKKKGKSKRNKAERTEM